MVLDHPPEVGWILPELVHHPGDHLRRAAEGTGYVLVVLLAHDDRMDDADLLVYGELELPSFLVPFSETIVREEALVHTNDYLLFVAVNVPVELLHQSILVRVIRVSSCW